MWRRIVSLYPELGLQHRQVRAWAGEAGKALLQRLVAYAEAFIAASGMGAEEAAAGYRRFVGRYMRDLKAFAQNGKYPVQEDAGAVDQVDRQAYELFLLMSPLVTWHRFSIMNQLEGLAIKDGPVLAIGVGVGLELEVAWPGGAAGEAWDLAVSPFVQTRHPEMAFRQGYFSEPDGQRFRTIVAVELLEHLAEPYALLARLRDALAPGGRLVVTTARNVPQFDHLYNFDRPCEFEDRARTMGLVVERAVDIPHDYLFLRVDAGNVFYELTYA